jgi:hypothetical protein
MTKISTAIDTKCGQGCEATGTFIPCWWECKTAQPPSESIGSFSQNQMFLPFDPAITHRLYLLKRDVTQKLTAASFIIVEIWKKLRFSSLGGWISEAWYIHTVEYYSVLKRTELANHEKTWWLFRHMILRERSQCERL